MSRQRITESKKLEKGPVRNWDEITLEEGKKHEERTARNYDQGKKRPINL